MVLARLRLLLHFELLSRNSECLLHCCFTSMHLQATTTDKEAELAAAIADRIVMRERAAELESKLQALRWSAEQDRQQQEVRAGRHCST